MHECHRSRSGIRAAPTQARRWLAATQGIAAIIRDARKGALPRVNAIAFIPGMRSEIYSHLLWMRSQSLMVRPRTMLRIALRTLMPQERRNDSSSPENALAIYRVGAELPASFFNAI